MNRLHFVALAAAMLAGVPAAATTIDFNSEPQNGVTSLSYPGVTITAFGGSLFTTTYGDTPNGTRGIIANDGAVWLPMRASFDSAVSFVSVDLGDWGADADTMFLRAYNAANVLLGSDSDFLAAGESAMRTLTVSAADIAYVDFGGVGYLDESNVYADNLTFGERGGVPEPATWAMMIAGFGLVGAASRRRRQALA